MANLKSTSVPADQAPAGKTPKFQAGDDLRRSNGNDFDSGDYTARCTEALWSMKQGMFTYRLQGHGPLVPECYLELDFRPTGVDAVASASAAIEIEGDYITDDETLCPQCHAEGEVYDGGKVMSITRRMLGG